MRPRESSEVLPGLQELRRLGRNINGYFGETIDIAKVLSDCVEATRSNGWQVEEIPTESQLNLIAATRFPARPGMELRTGRDNESTGHHARAPIDNDSRPAASTDGAARTLRVYISSGIHGDEPAGPLAIRQLLRENAWPEHLELWICPCLNPAGFIVSRRENSQGLDLNRQYLNPSAPETRAHIDWLHKQPSFDLSLCVHEDWESEGFYVYELNPDGLPSLAEAIVERVSRVCPIDRSELIEGRPANNGIIRPSLDPRSRPDWPEAFFLITHKSRLSYTLEAPSDFPLSTRVAALVEGIRAAVEKLGSSKG